MKARLIWEGNSYHLLLCTGVMRKLFLFEVRAFLENFDSPIHYSGNTSWDYDIPMEEFDGETLAYVNDQMQLVICSSNVLKTLLEPQEINYLTPSEYAEKIGKKRSIVARMCQNRRMPGVINANGRWLIPEDAPYPEDARKGEREKLIY